MENEEFQYYIDRLEEENSFFSLIEAGDEVLPMLEAQFERESSPERRAAVVRIMAEYRNPQSLTFFALTLSDSTPSVWQAALNGILNIGGEVAVAVLRSALSDSSPSKREWITEAISLVETGEEG